jgi:hypothetical protein
MDTAIELNYYQLTLLSFLIENHPELSRDEGFIKERAKRAAAAEVEALMEGYSQISATEFATKALYSGLHFSKYDTLRSILTEGFISEIPYGTIEAFVQTIWPFCEEVFVKYQPIDKQGNLGPFPDDFISSPQYDNLEAALCKYIRHIIHRQLQNQS